jgi:hypothetical protein
MKRAARALPLSLALALVGAHSASAQVPARSWSELPSANGYTGVVVNLDSAEIHHFRDHLFATEEPRWEADGTELWGPEGASCQQPQVVFARDLLHDAYFGLRVRGTSTWLDQVDVDRDASGYDGFTGRSERDGGTGIVRMVQPVDAAGVVATTRVFAPWSLEFAGFVMMLEVHNTAETATGPFSLYALVNANTGPGRPEPSQEIGATGETISLRGSSGILEQGFAGLVYAQGFPTPDLRSHSPAPFFETVRDGLGDLPTPPEGGSAGADRAGAFQWHFLDLAAGETVTVAVVVAYDANPDFVAGRADAVADWLDGRTPGEVLADERADWAVFQGGLAPPAGMSAAETDLYHHSAAILRMAQVRETQHYLRPEVDPGVPRWSGIDGATYRVTEGLVREHRGAGALLASLPPGRWAYAWVRDGAYAIAGLTDAGLLAEAEAGLRFFLDAEANRYVDYDELSAVPLSDYALSLTRYHGFGIEESDTLCNGDFNFEFDGFGLFLWALRHWHDRSDDDAMLAEYWPTIRDGIAEVLIGLVEPGSGLLYADSSIWEVHWLGKEKHFAYTNLTAARGLCDAAVLAEAVGDEASAARFEDAGRRLRRAIWERLRDDDGALAANTEELAVGAGYWDASVVEGVAMGLFDPEGETALATLAGIRRELSVEYGAGVFRTDDEHDPHGLSEYGSGYDSLEWVFCDYRLSIAARHAGDADYADTLQEWIRDQSVLNYLLIAENYDQNTGEYRSNVPMIGFGAGSYLSAMHQRAGDMAVEPACGVYFEDDPLYGPDAVGPSDPDADAGAPDAGSGDTGPDVSPDAPTDAGPDAPTDAAADGGGADARDAAADADEAGGDTATGDATSDADDVDADDGRRFLDVPEDTAGGGGPAPQDEAGCRCTLGARPGARTPAPAAWLFLGLAVLALRRARWRRAGAA